MEKQQTWTAVGRLSLAALPFAVFLAIAALLVVPVMEILGVRPLARWAWDSFETTASLWVRVGIATAVLAVTAALIYGIYRGGEWLYRVYRGW